MKIKLLLSLLGTIGLLMLLYQMSLLELMSSQTRIAELEAMLSDEVSKNNMLKERLQWLQEVRQVLEAQQKTVAMTAQNGQGKEQQHSRMAAAELPIDKIKASDSVVVTAHYVDDCLASRLQQLVQSSRSSFKGVRRDVWVIHSHYKFDERYQDGDNETFAQEFSRPGGLYADEEFPIISNDPKLLQSQKLIASIPGLRSASQSVLRSKFQLKFDEGSGSSKSSFLKLIAQYKYRFGWLVEDDMFYTGQWGALFDALDINATQGSNGRSSFMTNTVDALSVIHIQQNKESWWENPLKKCHVDTGQGDWPDSIRKCKIISSTQTGWMMIRVSENFAASLLRDLDPRARSAIGHHEPITGAYSKIHNFTVQSIPQEYIGHSVFGGWGKWRTRYKKSRLEHHAPIHHGKLYHPVKCSAYLPGGIDKDLKKWTTMNTKAKT